MVDHLSFGQHPARSIPLNAWVLWSRTGSGISAEVLTCIAQILTHLEAVLTAATWPSLGPTVGVYRGMLFFDGDINRVPLIAIVPSIAEAEPGAWYGVTAQSMVVDISAVRRIAPDENPSEIGESILGELIKTVFSNVPIGATDIVYQGGGVDQYPEFTHDLLTVGISVGIQWEFEDDALKRCLN